MKNFKIVDQPAIPSREMIEKSMDFDKLIMAYDSQVSWQSNSIFRVNLFAVLFSVAVVSYSLFIYSNTGKDVVIPLGNLTPNKQSIPDKPIPKEESNPEDSNQYPVMPAKEEPSTVIEMQETPKKQEIQVPTDSFKPEIINAEPLLGMENLYKYFNDSLRYPVELQDSGISGEVIVAFQIDKKGVISNIEIISSLGSLFDTEAIRLIKNMPQWNPASVNGHPISSKVSIPLIFEGRSKKSN